MFSWQFLPLRVGCTWCESPLSQYFPFGSTPRCRDRQDVDVHKFDQCQQFLALMWLQASSAALMTIETCRKWFEVASVWRATSSVEVHEDPFLSGRRS